MLYLETYLSTIRKRGNESLAKSIEYISEKIGREKLEAFDFTSHQVGLLFGNIQSGKTAQMFGIICKAADLGFPIFMLLTTDNVVLQQQTLERVQADMKGFCICDENDTSLFTNNNLIKPVIIVLKKNSRILKLWDSIINSTEFMRGNPLFIIDDEADAASLNTLINSYSQSSINKYLDSMKKESSSSLYLQVTGTPQAILLQTKNCGWNPSFIYDFKPGKGYLGGDFFFPRETPNCITFIEDERESLRDAVQHHLLVSAINILNDKKVCNFIIHPSVRIAEHSKFEQTACRILGEFKAILDRDDFYQELRGIYDKIQPKHVIKPPFYDVYRCIKKLLNDDLIKVLVLNGKREVDSTLYEEGYNIIIGGNTLGRGVTFPSLQTIYYTRSSKKPQADTMWQHSRMFGYDRDPGMMKVFIEKRLYKLFADINATNNSIVMQIEKGLNNIQIYYPETLSPTRKNVLDKNYVFTLSGGINYFPINVDNDNIDELDQLLEKFDDKTEYYSVNLRLIKKFLTHIRVEKEFPIQSFFKAIDKFLAERPCIQGCLIVRRERNIRRGSGALLSPIDWNLGGSMPDKLVLTMYKMTGDKGWKGSKIWIPNIKLPNNVVYYDVVTRRDSNA